MRPLTVVAAVTGFATLAIYVWLELLLPRGPQEFAYFPFMTDPLPFAPMRGFTFEQLVRHLGRVFLLGPALACLALVVARLVRKTDRRRIGPPGPDAMRLIMIAAVGISVVVTALVMASVLQGRAIVDDELAYRQQADLLSTGRLAEDTVPPWAWEVFTIWTKIGATGKYLFGEPLVQVPGTFLGLPALMHLLLAPLALWAWYRVVRRDAGTEVARWATILVAVSPMFMLTNALALSHTTTFTCLTLAGLGAQWARRERPVGGALLAGGALGFGLTVRPQVVVPIGLVIGLSALYQLLRRRHWPGVAALIGSGSVWLVLIGAYNHALFGSPFVLPWYRFLPVENFGFGHVGGIDFVHTPWTAVENLAVVAVQLNGWWLGWPLSLGLIVAWFALGRPREGAGLWLMAGAALVLLNLPYYSTGISETGPIYYFELLLPVAILGAHAVVRALARWPTTVTAILIVHFALGTTSFLWENVARLDRLVTVIHTPAEEVMAQIEPPALLIHENGWEESMRFGWVWSFPARFRNEGDPIVTYPRGLPQYLPALMKRYDYRQCWYYRLDPKTGRRELHRCRDAMELMSRQRTRAPAQRIESTAERLGLLSMQEAYFARSQAAARAEPE